jgi:hypothetical protein
MGMTNSATRVLSVASGLPPHSTGKERDTESGNDYFGTFDVSEGINSQIERTLRMNFRVVDSIHTILANMRAPRVCRQSLLMVSLAVGVAGSLVQAQVPSVGGEMAPPIRGVGHHYLGMSSDLLTETVNPATGSVSVSISLPTPPSRGFTFPFSIMYNSAGVNQLQYVNPGGTGNVGFEEWMTDNGTDDGVGWTYSIPLLTLSSDMALGSNALQAADGGTMSFEFSESSTEHSNVDRRESWIRTSDREKCSTDDSYSRPRAIESYPPHKKRTDSEKPPDFCGMLEGERFLSIS